VVEKIRLKYAYRASDWKTVKKAIRKDSALWKAPLEPIARPQDRFSCSDARLFRFMEAEQEVEVLLLEGTLLRGVVSWFSRFEFSLRTSKGGTLWVFRHAIKKLLPVG